MNDASAWRALLERLAGRVPTHARYQVDEAIARGGMGAIHRVFDEDLRRTLAMKVMLDGGAVDQLDDRTLGRFLEEAQITAQLDHPGVVPVHELGVDEDGKLFFTMKLVKGQDLRTVFDLVRSGEEGWNVTRALNRLLRVCEAMMYAHSKGVVHRDLKPANVMVGRFGETYVMDWGLARLGDADETPDVRLRPSPVASLSIVESDRNDARERASDDALVTMDGDVVGTPAYMAPEQAEGRLDAVGPRSDVYAVGAMLYHLLTGHSPYVRPGARISPHTLLAMVLQGPPRALDSITRDVPTELVAICEKAMARDLEDRYATMEELAIDLRAYLEGRVVRAHATGPIAELRKWVARNRAFAATVAAALVAVCALAVWAVVERSRAKEETAKVLRASDVKTVNDLIAEIDTLWPARPERAAAMESWLGRLERIRGRRAEHEATLAELSTRGDDDRTAWWREALVELLSGLDALAGDDVHGRTAAAIRARLDHARSIRAESIERHREEWDAAIASITDPRVSPRYGGLRLTPQVGLVPLGQAASGLWEFWHVPTGSAPDRDAEGRLAPGPESGLVFVLVPGGTFEMGAQADAPSGVRYDVDAGPDERPVASITLAPFFLSKYEMTQGQWRRFTGGNPSQYAPGVELAGRRLTLAHPVERVSWQTGVEVLRRLGLTLPTEAEWEYAARAGTDTPWWTGATRAGLDDAANLADRFCRSAGGPPSWTYEEELDDGYVVHAPVGSFAANPFGLHDTIGNVWEWCRDGYTGYDAPTAPGDAERVVEGAPLRVIRGGGFDSAAVRARSSYRLKGPPENLDSILGVRPARPIESVSK